MESEIERKIQMNSFDLPTSILQQPLTFSDESLRKILQDRGAKGVEAMERMELLHLYNIYVLPKPKRVPAVCDLTKIGLINRKSINNQHEQKIKPQLMEVSVEIHEDRKPVLPKNVFQGVNSSNVQHNRHLGKRGASPPEKEANVELCPPPLKKKPEPITWP